MARTFREADRFSLPFWRKGFSSVNLKQLMRLLHRHYGDKTSGKRNAPKSFRKSLDRCKDAKDRVALYNAITYDKEFLEYPRKKDANWEYW